MTTNDFTIMNYFVLNTDLADLGQITGCAQKMTQLVFVRTSSNSAKLDNFWHTDSQDDRNM